MTEETEDVKTEESSTEEWITENEVPETEEVKETEEEESESTEEENEDTEAEAEVEEDSETVEPKEKKEEPKIPLSVLLKERSRRKEIEEKLATFNAPAPKAEVPEDRPKRPTLKDSDYDEVAFEKALEVYEDTLLDWKIQLNDKERKKINQAKAQQEAAKKQNEELEKFYNEDEEYQNILVELSETEEEVVYPPAVANAVKVYGPKLDKYILQNRKELLPKLASMNATEQLIEIGKGMATISAEKPKSKATTIIKSKAPAPIKQTKSTPARVVVDGWMAS